MYINICAQMAANQKYIGKVSSVKYKLNVNNITKIIGKDKPQAKG